MARKSDFQRKIIQTARDAEPDIVEATDEEIIKAAKLREVILKYPRLHRTPRAVLDLVIKPLGISLATFYRKRRRFEKKRTLSSLFSRPGSGGRGLRRIPQESLDVIKTSINNRESKHGTILTSDLIEIAKRQCRKKGFHIPSDNTIRSIINENSIYDRSKAKFNDRYTQVTYDSHPGFTPETNVPLERIQIDHTLVDIVALDPFYRIPLGRPYITIVMDEYTRAILGFALSFRPPSATVVAFAMTKAVLPKKAWLDNIGVNHDWPMQGLSCHVFVDNGMDLKANALIYGCLEHGIERPEHRSPGRPFTGGFVERAIGTLMSKMKICNGNTTKVWEGKKTTFDPEEKAEMTLFEIEKFLATYIAGVYNKKQRSELDWQSPQGRWETFFNGTDMFGKSKKTIPPQPRMPLDPDRFVMDFLPRDSRTIDKNRVRIHNMSYWGEALKYIARTGDAREYEFRWSHQDISRIYWKDPKTGLFIPINNSKGHKGPIELEEWKRAGRRLQELGHSPKDEEARFRALDEMDDIMRLAASDTRRKKRERIKKKNKDNREIFRSIAPSTTIGQSVSPSVDAEENPKKDNFVPNRTSNIRRGD